MNVKKCKLIYLFTEFSIELSLNSLPKTKDWDFGFILDTWMKNCLALYISEKQSNASAYQEIESKILIRAIAFYSDKIL